MMEMMSCREDFLPIEGQVEHQNARGTPSSQQFRFFSHPSACSCALLLILLLVNTTTT